MDDMRSLRLILLIALTCLTHGQARSSDYQRQLEHTSRLFLGTPYQFSNIKDPLPPEQGVFYDPSHLDCMTYVMSTLALNENPENWLKNWLSLRYQNTYDFWGRNHFASIDFNPVLEKTFQLSDLSQHMDGAINQTFLVQKPLWFLAQMPQLCQKNRCHNVSNHWQKFLHQNPIKVSISTVPYDKIIHEGQINPRFVHPLPHISIIEFVRIGWPIGQMISIPISHMGFLIKKKDRLIFRHAKWQRTVQDEDFLSYIQKVYTDPSHLGIHILG